MMEEKTDVIIAIDSWKGCLTSSEANEAALRGVQTRFPNASIQCITVSDGGEGFLDAVEATDNYQRVTVNVFDPLMRPIRADYLICGNQAVIEMAQASGLHLLKPEERNPLVASSYGTGQLIADAISRGATDIIIGLGGSATSDCGRGMLNALNKARFPFFGESGVRFTIATDVTNPLLGSQGATYVFALQKTSPSLSSKSVTDLLKELEARSQEFASTNAQKHGYDCSNASGAGAAGGLGYAFMQYLGARRISGAEFVIRNLPRGRVVITGEGRADSQTLMGKLPFIILQKAKSQGIPVILLAGQVNDREALLSAGFSQVLCVNPQDCPLEECMRPDVASARITEKFYSIHDLAF